MTENLLLAIIALFAVISIVCAALAVVLAREFKKPLKLPTR